MIRSTRKTGCGESEGRQPGKQVARLLTHFSSDGYIVYTDNCYTSVGLLRQLKHMEQRIGLTRAARKERLPDVISLVHLGKVNELVV